jgi:hypothetical protein
MLSQKLLVHVGVFTFAGKKPTFGGKNSLDLPLILLASVLSAIPP